MGWGKTIGIGCLSAVAGVGLFVFIIFLVVTMLTAGPEQVVQQFLTAAAAGDYAGAHDCFSIPLKEQQSLEAFTSAVKASPSLFAVADTTFNERSIDTSGAKVAGSARLKAGTNVPVSFSLVKENGAWKIIEYHIGLKD